MKLPGKIYRWILPLFLASVFSLTLYIAQVLPPDRGEMIYDWSLLALLVLFLVMLGFVVHSAYRAGELLYRSKTTSTNKIFLILGLMFLFFAVIFGGVELYLQEIIFGSYPAGPFLLLAGGGGLLGWRLRLSVYDNGLRPPGRDFIDKEKINSFLWLDEVFLFTSCFLPPGGRIDFEVPQPDVPDIFAYLLSILPLRQIKSNSYTPGEDLNSGAIAGYYFSLLEAKEELTIKNDEGIQTCHKKNNGETHRKTWPGADFSKIKKLLIKLAAGQENEDNFREGKIKLNRLEDDKKDKTVSRVITVKFKPEEELFDLKFDGNQN